MIDIAYEIGIIPSRNPRYLSGADATALLDVMALSSKYAKANKDLFCKVKEVGLNEFKELKPVLIRHNEIIINIYIQGIGLINEKR